MPLRPPDARFIKALYAVGLGPIVGKLLLLLTTTGRKTGLPRVTPLQYEEINGAFYLGSSKGVKADWVQNILANPHVSVRVKTRKFQGTAEVITDPCQVADFIQYRLKHRPRIIGGILKSEGLSLPPSREELESYSRNLAMVIIHPDPEG